jgi:hypothetical protein
MDVRVSCKPGWAAVLRAKTKCRHCQHCMHYAWSVMTLLAQYRPGPAKPPVGLPKRLQRISAGPVPKVRHACSLQLRSGIPRHDNLSAHFVMFAPTSATKGGPLPVTLTCRPANGGHYVLGKYCMAVGSMFPVGWSAGADMVMDWNDSVGARATTAKSPHTHAPTQNCSFVRCG